MKRPEFDICKFGVFMQWRYTASDQNLSPMPIDTTCADTE